METSNPSPASLLAKQAALAKRRSLNDKFMQGWWALKGIPLKEEHQFHPKRKWRFDYAHMETMVAIELEGITHAGGRHQRFSGYTADVEKYNEAALLGWTVMRLTKGQINLQNLTKIIDLITLKKRMKDHYESQAAALTPRSENQGPPSPPLRLQ